MFWAALPLTPSLPPSLSLSPAFPLSPLPPPSPGNMNASCGRCVRVSDDARDPCLASGWCREPGRALFSRARARVRVGLRPVWPVSLPLRAAPACSLARDGPTHCTVGVTRGGIMVSSLFLLLLFIVYSCFVFSCFVSFILSFLSHLPIPSLLCFLSSFPLLFCSILFSLPYSLFPFLFSSLHFFLPSSLFPLPFPHICLPCMMMQGDLGGSYFREMELNSPNSFAHLLLF